MDMMHGKCINGSVVNREAGKEEIMKRFGIVPAAVLVAALAWMGTDASASLNVTRYDVNQAAGGLTIHAQYDPADIDPECCDPMNVRWIQRVLLTDGMGAQLNTVPGYPSGDFIDPQQVQGPGFDNLPWYDATYNTAADRNANMNRQFGAGPFYLDTPGGWLPFGPLTFSASTLLVCVDPVAKSFEFLAGFSWGFSINAAMNMVTALPLMELADTAGLRMTINNSLGLGQFAGQGWMMVQNSDEDCYLDVNFVPEPGTISLVMIGVVAIGLSQARHLRRRQAA